jgi:hypothetical protein
LAILSELAIKVGMKAITCPEASDCDANQAQPRDEPRRIEMTVEFWGGEEAALELVAGTILEGKLEGKAGVEVAIGLEVVAVPMAVTELVVVEVGWLMRRVEVGTQSYWVLVELVIAVGTIAVELSVILIELGINVEVAVDAVPFPAIPVPIGVEVSVGVKLLLVEVKVVPFDPPPTTEVAPEVLVGAKPDEVLDPPPTTTTVLLDPPGEEVPDAPMVEVLEGEEVLDAPSVEVLESAVDVGPADKLDPKVLVGEEPVLLVVVALDPPPRIAEI